MKDRREPPPEPSPRSGPHPRAELDEWGVYQTSGTVLLTCPRLLELDPRHGIKHDKWPASWRDSGSHDGQGWQLRPPHERYLQDLEGHDSNTYSYFPGARPHLESEWPYCLGCGRALVASDGDPIAEPLPEWPPPELAERWAYRRRLEGLLADSLRESDATG